MTLSLLLKMILSLLFNDSVSLMIIIKTPISILSSEMLTSLIAIAIVEGCDVVTCVLLTWPLALVTWRGQLEFDLSWVHYLLMRRYDPNLDYIVQTVFNYIIPLSRNYIVYSYYPHCPHSFQQVLKHCPKWMTSFPLNYNTVSICQWHCPCSYKWYCPYSLMTMSSLALR